MHISVRKNPHFPGFLMKIPIPCGATSVGPGRLTRICGCPHGPRRVAFGKKRLKNLSQNTWMGRNSVVWGFGLFWTWKLTITTTSERSFFVGYPTKSINSPWIIPHGPGSDLVWDCIPSGYIKHGYWKWPSRRQWVFCEKGMVEFSILLYQRVINQ